MIPLEDTARKHFNRVALGQDTRTYEDMRWNKDSRVRAQYQATKSFLTSRVVPLLSEGDRVLELGAGPGTWTKVLASERPTLQITLTDISAEMLNRAVENLREITKPETIEGDFNSVVLEDGPYDFFFSSRAFEYISEKERAVDKIHTLLRSGGGGCITTKIPKPLAHRLRGYAPSALHGKQISPAQLKQYLSKKGFIQIQLYPVTVSAPFFKSGFADKVLGRLISWMPLNPVTATFVESYGVLFKKP